VKEGGEPRTLVPACRFAHTLQPGRPVTPARCPARGLRQRVSLTYGKRGLAGGSSLAQLLRHAQGAAP
jgi:hypothetical protein